MSILLPILQWKKGDDNGSYENAADGFYKLRHNTFLLTLVVLYTISIAFYNFLGVTITKELSAHDKSQFSLLLRNYTQRVISTQQVHNDAM